MPSLRTGRVHLLKLAVATSLQLFNKVDLQTVMKAGRWSNGGTFTSFYLRDLCPQADSLRKTGLLVAAGEMVSLKACSASFICFSSSFYTVNYHWGTLLAPHSFFFKGRGGQPEGPPGGTLVQTSFCLWESHCVYHLGGRSDRLPSLFCQILSDFLSDSKLSYELFKLFVTELKFL